MLSAPATKNPAPNMATNLSPAMVLQSLGWAPEIGVRLSPVEETAKRVAAELETEVLHPALMEARDGEHAIQLLFERFIGPFSQYLITLGTLHRLGRGPVTPSEAGRLARELTERVHAEEWSEALEVAWRHWLNATATLQSAARQYPSRHAALAEGSEERDDLEVEWMSNLGCYANADWGTAFLMTLALFATRHSHLTRRAPWLPEALTGASREAFIFSRRLLAISVRSDEDDEEGEPLPLEDEDRELEEETMAEAARLQAELES